MPRILIASPKTLQAANKHLAGHDPKLAAIIASAGPCTITPHTNYYQELVESIVSQQLSVKAARSIMQKFLGLFGGSFPGPEQILGKDVDELRTAGLSRAKAMYIRDLAQHVLDGRIKFDHFDDLDNNEIIAELTAVKGIGEWTAHMFLMFAMGRLDVLAHGDLGIKNGVQKLYGLATFPLPADVQAVATRHSWHPYETVACWYIWHSLDNV